MIGILLVGCLSGSVLALLARPPEAAGGFSEYWQELSPRQRLVFRISAAVGNLSAQRDAQSGRLRLRTAGLYRSDGLQREAELTRRFGVEFDHVAGCMPTVGQSGAMWAYNLVMREEIRRRLGEAALADIELDVF